MNYLENMKGLDVCAWVCPWVCPWFDNDENRPDSLEQDMLDTEG